MLRPETGEILALVGSLDYWNAAIDGKYMLPRVTFGNGRWVGVGDRGRIASSPDAKTWKDAEGTKPIDTLVDVNWFQKILRLSVRTSTTRPLP